MRVLVLSNHYREPEVREKYRAAAALGTELVVASAEPQSVTDGGVRLVAVKASGKSTEVAQLRWRLASFKRLFSDERPDLVHIEADPETPLAVAGSTVAQSLGCPYAVFSWRAVKPGLGLFAARRYRRVLRHATGVIGGSRAAMDLLRDRAPSAIATVLPLYGAAAAAEPRQPTSPTLVVGFAGRLVPERGADVLVRALSQTFGKWNLVIAGTGPDQEALEALIQRLGLASRVRWACGSPREALAELWSEIDCLVVPSRDTPTWVEYHSPILLEAMGRGVAPIVTRAGCLPDLVGDAGVVVDSPEHLSEVLQAWVAQPSTSHQVGRRARQRVLDRFITPSIAERTVNFWREMLSHSAASAATSTQESV